MTEKLNAIRLDIPSELIGERIVLRAFCDNDAPHLWNAVDTSREHLKRWMPWVNEHNSLDFSRDYVRRMQAKWILREDLPMGIWRKADNHLLGATGLHRIDWTIPAMEIGYWLRADAEGNGYTTEAVKLITAFAFGHLLAERVTIVCDSKNSRSAGVPPRAGFTHEATMRNERRDTNGDLSDTELFAMTRAGFDKRHG
jgi:RimJ/RimL family protein N-acetyltransferase